MPVAGKASRGEGGVGRLCRHGIESVCDPKSDTFLRSTRGTHTL